MKKLENNLCWNENPVKIRPLQFEHWDATEILLLAGLCDSGFFSDETQTVLEADFMNYVNIGIIIPAQAATSCLSDSVICGADTCLCNNRTRNTRIEDCVNG